MPNIDAMRYVFALMLGLGLALLPAGRLVRAQGLPDALISAQIVPGWRLPDGQQMVALHVRLAQNWKTYWRAPGAAGVAPRFAWAGSQNLRGVQILWPVPRVFDLGGYQTIGYAEELILPILLTPQDIAQPIALKLGMDLGICHDICMPLRLDLAAAVPLQHLGPKNALIEQALAAQPQSAAAAGVGDVSCTVAPIADGLRLTAEIDLGPDLGWAGGGYLGVIELPDPEVWVSEVLAEQDQSRLRLTSDLVPPRGVSLALNRGDIRLTLLHPGGAIDLMGCPAPQR